jgi:hypothetical protein
MSGTKTATTTQKNELQLQLDGFYPLTQRDDEITKAAAKQGYQFGWDLGAKAGVDVGWKAGAKAGSEAGYKVGYEAGRKVGGVSKETLVAERKRFYALGQSSGRAGGQGGAAPVDAELVSLLKEQMASHERTVKALTEQTTVVNLPDQPITVNVPEQQPIVIQYHDEPEAGA